jgi:hypothetical protein
MLDFDPFFEKLSSEVKFGVVGGTAVLLGTIIYWANDYERNKGKHDYRKDVTLKALLNSGQNRQV